MKYNRKSEYLPKKLIKVINEEILNKNTYEYRTKNNFLKCIGIIYEKQINEYHNLNAYVATGSNYWKTVYGNDYHEKVIKPLIDIGILQSYDFGYRKVFVGIRYRVNPLLTDDECEDISYINKGKVKSVEEILYNDDKEFSSESIPDKNFMVSINSEKANEWIMANAEKICKDYLHPEYIQHLPDNLIIEFHEDIEGLTMNTRYSRVGLAKSIAASQNKQLFFFKDKYYIASIPEFLEVRIPSLIYHYNREISKVGKLPIGNGRSTVTLRLHNYLVNFPSKILQFIFINNQTVVQLDLRTSQFLLFANLLNVYINQGEQVLLLLFKQNKTIGYIKRLIKVLKTYQLQLPSVGVDINDQKSGKYSSTDVIKFIRDIFFTDFYSVIQRELGFPERSIAKLVLFKLLFKKTNRRDALLDKLMLRYPIVMSIIADFKKNDKKESEHKSINDDDRESNFSVFLQCVEAEIFIDNILLPLRADGLPCFTRHDSIVVASEYAEDVESYAKAVFHKFGFKYNHKAEDKFWEVVDQEELEDSGYIDWISDENELNTDFSIDGSLAEPTMNNDSDTVEKNNELPIKHNDTMQDNLNDMQIETIEGLLKIGVRNDYYELVSMDLLEDISNLPISDSSKNTLYDEIINLRDGMSFFQERTNEIIRNIVLHYMSMY